MCGPERCSDASTFSLASKREESVCVSGVLVACGAIGVRYLAVRVRVRACTRTPKAPGLQQVGVYIRHDTRAKPYTGWPLIESTFRCQRGVESNSHPS